MNDTPARFRSLGRNQLARIPQLDRLDPDLRRGIEAAANVLPFKVNPYVLDALIDWDRVPDDPMFQLTFPQPGMLSDGALREMRELLDTGAPRAEIDALANRIRAGLNPHPAGQLTLNVPQDGDETVPGMQHKYAETLLYFPRAGQTCHTYCTYCFRWPQFVGPVEQRLRGGPPEQLAGYVAAHPELRSVLFTGGDPMVMRTDMLRRFIEPLLAVDHLTSIRFGTKAMSYWPSRFTEGDDADDLMRLFEDIVAAGKHVAVMAHFSHPRELAPQAAKDAIRRSRSAGAVIRAQCPMIHRVNDDAATLSEMYREQVRLGVIPYYLFVERDTGPRGYFEVPLARALSVFQKTYRTLSGLGRTLRGPVMSCTPGKVAVRGTAIVGGQRAFVLEMLQARDPSWTGRPFFAKFDPNATWIDELTPLDAPFPWQEPPSQRSLSVVS
ncbi:MAG: KamA family radical SAM protein [Sandaracinaceae bacterium]